MSFHNMIIYWVSRRCNDLNSNCPGNPAPIGTVNKADTGSFIPVLITTLDSLVIQHTANLPPYKQKAVNIFNWFQKGPDRNAVICANSSKPVIRKSLLLRPWNIRAGNKGAALSPATKWDEQNQLGAGTASLGPDGWAGGEADSSQRGHISSKKWGCGLIGDASGVFKSFNSVGPWCPL